MTTREEMRSLAEEIVDAYTDRVATIAELRKTVKTELKELKDARIDLGRIDLGKELRADLAKSAADCKRGVSAMFRGFGQVHASMSKKMRADLDKGVADRKGEVDNMLKGFSAELKEIRSEIAGVGDSRRRRAVADADYHHAVQTRRSGYKGEATDWGDNPGDDYPSQPSL